MLGFARCRRVEAAMTCMIEVHSLLCCHLFQPSEQVLMNKMHFHSIWHTFAALASFPQPEFGAFFGGFWSLRSHQR